MNGPALGGGGSLGNPGPAWHVKGTGDFYDNGYSDILWQNDDGEVSIWEMNGTTQVGGGSVGNPGPSWHVIGTGDYYGNGYSDILLQNSRGDVSIWEMNGTSIVGGGSLGNPGASWHVEPDSSPFRASAVDLPWQSDVTATILLQNDNGDANIWQTNGTAQTGAEDLGNPGASWHVRATGDMAPARLTCYGRMMTARSLFGRPMGQV